MTDLQAWPPLCGAVAGCGALLAVAGLAKLGRSVRGAGRGTAVQKALRLGDESWRIFQAAAGIAELAVGLLVCAGAHPAVADALMAGQGAIFLGVLGYLSHQRMSGDCGCVARRRPASPEQPAVTPLATARAAFISLTGVTGAVASGRAPYTLARFDQPLAWAVATLVLALLVLIDLELHTPRCRRALLFSTRTTLAEVTGHDLYKAMAASLGAEGERVLFRRLDCIDEFWFPAGVSGSDDVARYLTIDAARTASGALALRASVAEHVPPGGFRLLRPRRPLAVRRGSGVIQPNRLESQPSGRRARLQQ